MEINRVTYKELDISYPELQDTIKEKAVKLANGMISVYGQNRDTAIVEAISIAKEWYYNGKKYTLLD